MGRPTTRSNFTRPKIEEISAGFRKNIEIQKMSPQFSLALYSWKDHHRGLLTAYDHLRRDKTVPDEALSAVWQAIMLSYNDFLDIYREMCTIFQVLDDPYIRDHFSRERRKKRKAATDRRKARSASLPEADDSQKVTIQ